MTLTQMRYFLEVCKHGSVSRAAEALYISQPSVSSAIRELEDELGVNLFHRIKMRLSLTQEGKFFLERTSQIMKEIDFLTVHMKDLGNKRNRIRIGVPPMIGTFLFPSIFSAFHNAFPDIEIEMAEYGSRKIREMVLDEELDVAIAIADAKRDVPYHAILMLRTTLLFTVSPTHPLAGRDTIRLEELNGEPLILFQGDSHQTRILNERFAALGVKPRIELASSQLYTIKKMIAGGRQGAFLFREVTAMETDVIGIPLKEPIDLDICLIWKKDRQMFSDSIKLVRFVKESFGEI